MFSDVVDVSYCFANPKVVVYFKICVNCIITFLVKLKNFTSLFAFTIDKAEKVLHTAIVFTGFGECKDFIGSGTYFIIVVMHITAVVGDSLIACVNIHTVKIIFVKKCRILAYNLLTPSGAECRAMCRVADVPVLVEDGR